MVYVLTQSQGLLQWSKALSGSSHCTAITPSLPQPASRTVHLMKLSLESSSRTNPQNSLSHLLSAFAKILPCLWRLPRQCNLKLHPIISGFPYTLALLIFLHRTYHYLTYFILDLFLYVSFSAPLECKHQKGRDFCFVHCYICSAQNRECLAQNRSSVNLCWLAGWLAGMLIITEKWQFTWPRESSRNENVNLQEHS